MQKKSVSRSRPNRSDRQRPAAPWTFLTNHAHVLVCIARDPEVRMRDVAEMVGITERAVQRIVRELEEGGYLQRQKEGRQNHYRVRSDLPFRHPLESNCNVSALIQVVLESGRRG